MAGPSLWQRIVREAQRPGSVALAGLGTGLLAAGVVNPPLAVLAAPVYALWGVSLVNRAFRKPDLRADALQEIEKQLEQVAVLRYGRAHPPEGEADDSFKDSAVRVRDQFERLMAELEIARGRERPDAGAERERELSAREFESRLRQFRRITEGEDAILNRLRASQSAVLSLPPGLLADVSQLVNWAEAISRQRAAYLLTLAQHPLADTLQRLTAKRRQAAAARADERAEIGESITLLEQEVERFNALQREVRSIDNQLDMIESLIRNLILSTPNVPNARDQILRVKRNVETYQQINREVREQLENRRSATLPPPPVPPAARSGSA